MNMIQQINRAPICQHCRHHQADRSAPPLNWCGGAPTFGLRTSQITAEVMHSEGKMLLSETCCRAFERPNGERKYTASGVTFSDQPE